MRLGWVVRRRPCLGREDDDPTTARGRNSKEIVGAPDGASVIVWQCDATYAVAMTNSRAIIAERRQALLGEWRRDVTILVRIEGPAALTGLSALLTGGRASTLVPLGRRDTDNVVIWRRHGHPHHAASLWVRARYRDYRQAYLDFLRDVYGVDATTDDLGTYEIDHLLNAARAPADDCFIRLEAVPALVNRRWGALFERAATERRDPTRVSARRVMSWAIASKLAGQMPPNDARDEAGFQRLARFWAGQGFTEQEAMAGLRAMWAFTYRDR
jgi:hypothetical protein